MPINGRAMAFYGLLLIDIRPNATVLISHNRALTYGGGIYVDDYTTPFSRLDVFLSLHFNIHMQTAFVGTWSLLTTLLERLAVK